MANDDRPRFRSNLKAQRGESQGIVYYDVSDSKVRSTFRMYEVEYFIAIRLDGRRLEEIAEEAQHELRIATDVEELGEFVAKLGQLGFLESGPAELNAGVERSEMQTSQVETPRARAEASSEIQTSVGSEPHPMVFPEVAEPVKIRSRLPITWLILPVLLTTAFVVAVSIPEQAVAPLPLVRTEVAQLRNVVRLYPGAVGLRVPESLRYVAMFGGVVAELAAPGQQVQVGDPVVKFKGFMELENQVGRLRAKQALLEGRPGKALSAAKRTQVARLRKQVGALQARLAERMLSAKEPGVVSEVWTKVGDAIVPGRPLVAVRQDRLRADFELPSADMASLRPGMVVGLLPSDANSMDPFEGRIEKIEERGAKTLVQVEVTQAPKTVRAGASVELVRRQFPQVVELPESALRRRGDSHQIYVVEDGKARPRSVILAEHEGGRVLVTQGLTAGDQVAVTGVSSLRAGVGVQIEPTDTK